VIDSGRFTNRLSSGKRNYGLLTDVRANCRRDFKVPFVFTAKIDKLTFNLARRR